MLRRPPPGPLLPTAHDVLREFRVLSLLQDEAVRVPRVVACLRRPRRCSARRSTSWSASRARSCADRLPDWLDAAASARLGLDLADALAEIHRVDPEAFVAAGIGEPDGYLDRQLVRWVGQREGIRTAVAAAGGEARDLPDYDVVRDWLGAHRPDPVPPTVVHGDFKLDNVIVDPERGRASGWSSTGRWRRSVTRAPTSATCSRSGRSPASRCPLGMSPTSDGGFPTRAELVERWEATTGRAAGDTRWFVTLAVWKLAILLEASYHRWLAGMSDDPFFGTLDTGVPELLAHAREVAGA